MISHVNTAVCEGIGGVPVLVETDISNGLPQIHIVGLASTVVMESRERIKSAIVNSGFDYPRRRVTVNLIPAGMRKNGTHLDLPIAMGILSAMGYVKSDALNAIGFVGELTLQGNVYPADGVLPMVIAMAGRGLHKVVVPLENIAEAQLAQGVEIIGVQSLAEGVDAVRRDFPLSNVTGRGQWSGHETPREIEGWESEDREETCAMETEESVEIPDFGDIRGQEQAKRGLLIAAAGHHGILLMGNPGCGKTMLAKRFPSILPPMTQKQIVDTTVIYSVAGKLKEGKNRVP